MILADIAALETRINDLLARLPGDLDPTRRRFKGAAAEAVLAILDDFPLDELRALDLAQLVEDALGEVIDDLERELGRAIGERVQQIIADTAAFYDERGIDTGGVREVAARSETAQQLADFLDRGMSLTRTSLQDATVELVQDAVAAGKINRNDLRDAIAARAESSAHHATTQAGTSIAAYNQTYRNTLAERASLDQFMYFGSLVAGSRPFCRACAGKVFTAAQIDAMDNAMLNPVKVFRGAWNCRHSWLPVDPDWDDELQSATVDLDEAVEIPTGGGRALKVFLNPDQAGRLREQIGLARVGYDQFFDAEMNDQGYVAVHPSWRTLRGQQKLDGAAYRTLADEFDVAAVLAERGDLAQLNPDVPNLRGGPSDLIWNGLVTELKTPRSTAHVATYNRIRREADQADVFLFNLRDPIDEPERAMGRLRHWLQAHPGKQIWLLHRHDNDNLEDIN